MSDAMIVTPYQQYLYLVGQLKDGYKLNIDVNHRDIHTFFKDKKPLFKLLFGEYSENKALSIVVSFHIDLMSPAVIQWFLNIKYFYPPIKVAEHFIEDSNGETYLGDDADQIRSVKLQQEILDKWLNSKTEEEIKKFVESKVVGRIRDLSKTYNSQTESAKAKTEFDLMQKASDDKDLH